MEALIWIDYIKLRFKLDEISAYKGNNKENKIIDDYLILTSPGILNVELEYSLGGIQAPIRFLQYFKNFFEEYIDKEECFFDSFVTLKNLQKKIFFIVKMIKN